MRRDDDGQVLVLVALAMAVLLLGLGLAVDTGRLFVARRAQQAASDAAAWAGAVALQGGASATTAHDAAVLDAQRNGYVTGGNVVVTVNVPPTSGSQAGNSAYVEAIVRDIVVPTFFHNPTALTTRSVAGLAAAGTYSEGLLALNTTGTAIAVSGTGTRTVLGGVVQADSSAATAITLANSASLTADAIRAVGSTTDTSSGAYTPTPAASAATRPDPFLGLAAPSTTGLATRADPNATTGSVALQPGIYPSLTVTNKASATLASGVYVVRGKVTVSGSGKLSGTGVLIYTTYSNYPAAFVPGTPCGTVAVSTDTALTAATSGTYAGLLLFHDRNCTTAYSLTANGDVTRTSISGTIYVPKAAFTLTGVATAATLTTQIVAASIALPSGNITIDVRDHTKLAPPLVPTVVE